MKNKIMIEITISDVVKCLIVKKRYTTRVLLPRRRRWG